jgi:hypothetical protein
MKFLSFDILYIFFNFQTLNFFLKILTLTNGISTPPTHGISTPLPMVYRPPYPWYFDPPIHSILTPLPMVY